MDKRDAAFAALTELLDDNAQLRGRVANAERSGEGSHLLLGYLLRNRAAVGDTIPTEVVVRLLTEALNPFVTLDGLRDSLDEVFNQ